MSLLYNYSREINYDTCIGESYLEKAFYCVVPFAYVSYRNFTACAVPNGLPVARYVFCKFISMIITLYSFTCGNFGTTIVFVSYLLRKFLWGLHSVQFNLLCVYAFSGTFVKMDLLTVMMWKLTVMTNCKSKPSTMVVMQVYILYRRSLNPYSDMC